MYTRAEDVVNTYADLKGKIYAYSTPDVPKHDGWLKIGYTEKQTVEERIIEQTYTVDIDWEVAWKKHAVYKKDKDGKEKPFNDKVFHRYLEKNGVERKPNKEWFRISAATSEKYFDDFASRKLPVPDEELEYKLRHEQDMAVVKTMTYFNGLDKKDYGTEKAKFLWNAKPRFGKTLTTYDLIRRMGFKKVLIVTNRPSISDSWVQDFYTYISWRKELCFVSENETALGYPGVTKREDYISAHQNDGVGMVAFESLQGLKSSYYFGRGVKKLEWMAKEYQDESGKLQHGTEFDLLVIDESHEGAGTIRADEVFENISRKYTLYLSGTPFKALANKEFPLEEQIFTWSYVDEQEVKKNWKDDDGANPYGTMPTLTMFTYQLSPMICDKIQEGTVLPGTDEVVDYAFDLNEFFRTEGKKFVHEKEIRKFLHSLTTKEKYPFSTDKLRQDLSHTLWLLDRVESAKALKRLLKEEKLQEEDKEKNVFREYEIVVVAGDGKSDENDNTKRKDALKRVRDAIKSHKKTITLSVGQLTVGVTVPQWSGVLMLRNMKSPAAYIQAVFRAQNEYVFTDTEKNNRPMYKENAYVFDFDPARTLAIYDEFAKNLSGGKTRGNGINEGEENNKRLLNYFPVFGEDSNGELVELDAAQVLSIPRTLKSQEVVRRGFMSNLLFQDVSNVLSVPSEIREILEKLTPSNETAKRRANKGASTSGPVNKGGKGGNLFGKKIYEDLKKTLGQHANTVTGSGYDASIVKQQIDALKDKVLATIIERIVIPVVNKYGLPKGRQEKMEEQLKHEIDDKFEGITRRYERAVADKVDKKSAWEALLKEVDEIIKETVKKKGSEFEKQGEEYATAEIERDEPEKRLRACLRGFFGSIPSFIMAYDDGDLNLRNFDKKVEDDVFKEVTGITKEEFCSLRDDWKCKTEFGEEKIGLFDEALFDTSVREFRKKRQELANYFDEKQKEDIFDYIPPLRTNQIFTPKWVVKKMVDDLEANNPGCFDNPENTFADLYMKSGQYIAEIVKRLFRSKKMKRLFPDDKKRIQHILTKQVYGMAPTRIIYLIATNYILGFDEKLKTETKNFVQADAAKAAQEGTLAELVKKHFGKSK